MVFRFKQFLFFSFLGCVGHQALASPPSLSIRPADFRYTASATAVLVDNCLELQDPNNLLIAYVNGQLRGYVNSSTMVGSRYMAFLTIYSNLPSGDTVKFQIYQAATDKLLTVKTTLLFSDDGIYGNPSAPQEMQTNNRPINLQLSTVLVEERPAANANLATITAVELDKDNTLFYSLVSGANSTDNGLFQVVGNQLQVKGTLNTTAIDTFKIRLRATDNFGCYVEKAFALKVDKVNDAPVGLRLSDSTFFENATGPFVGSFRTTDLDMVDQFTYSFIAGTGDVDNAKFAIYDSSLFFKTSANFEVKKTYSVRIRVTDSGGLSYDKTFSLYVKDANDLPTNIALSNTKVYENEAADQYVAKISTTDEDVLDKYTYSFANLGTNDNFSFTIVKDTLRASKVFDFETKSAYIIYLTSTDSLGLSTTKQFTITIKDTLDAPSDMLISNASITENSAKGTFIGTFSTVDAKSAGTYIYTYTLVSGPGSSDNARFYIKNDTLYNNQVFNYEANKSFSIRVKSALINGMSVEKVFAISVNNVSASNIALTNKNAYENEPVNQFVAVISTISLDPQTKYEYSFGNVGTNDNNSFTISNDTLRASQLFDFEIKNSYVIYLTSTDSSNVSITKVFTISVRDALDAPTDILLSNAELSEGMPSKTFIGVLSTVDANAPPVTYSYTLVAGKGSTDNGSFFLSNDSLFSNVVFDFEKKTSYSLRAKTTLVNNMSTEKEFIITIKDILSTNISLSNNKVFENASVFQFVAKISTITKDTSDAYQYTFGNVGTNDNNSFTLSQDSLFANRVFDYETKDSYLVYLVSTSLSGTAITRSFTITIKDSLDVPTDIVLSNVSITENLPKHTFIGKLNTIDANTSPVSYVYTTAAGVGDIGNNSFSISNDSLYSNQTFDFEKQTSYSIRVRSALVNKMYIEKVFVISIKDVVSSNMVLSNTRVFENELYSQFVAKISTVSLDTSDAYQYSFGNVGTNDNNSFTLSQDSLFANKVFDYETKDGYLVYLVSTSLSGAAITRSFTIGIKDSLDVPSDVVLSNTSITENLPKNTFISKLNTIDANTLPVIYAYTTVSGVGDMGNNSFRISNDSLYSNQTFDFEKQSSYSIRVRSALVNKMYIEKVFVIGIKDVVATNMVLSNTRVFENELYSQFVARISTVSLDTSDAYQYSFGNVGTNDNNSFTLSRDSLFANRVFDFETKDSYLVYLVSTSLSGAAITRSFTIGIKDSLDVPTDLLLSNATITETLPSNTFIGRLNTIDANRQPVNYTYSAAAGQGDSDNTFFRISNDSLFSKVVFDFEKKTSYSIRVRSALVNKMYIEKVFVIGIKDLVATNMMLSNTRVFENELYSQFVAKISNISLDTSDSYQYSFGNVGTNDNNNFTLSHDSLFANKVFDYESKDSYLLYLVSTSLSGASITRSFTIGIKDSLDVPTDLLLSNATITETLPSNTFIGRLNTIDANRQPVNYTYSATAGQGDSDNAFFRVSRDSLFSNVVFDFEKKTSYSIRVRSALVNKMYIEKVFVIGIKDLPSTDMDLSNMEVYENASRTQLVAKISTVSQDTSDTYQYSFGNIGTNDNTSFRIVHDSLFANKVFDYENKNNYVIYIVSMSLSGVPLTRSFTIGIKDSLDIPTDLNLSTTFIDENLPVRTFIGVFTTEDANKPPVDYAYRFVAGTGSVDSSSFLISNDSLYTKVIFDAEVKTTYRIRVRSTLINSMYVEKALTIQVPNINEPPTFLTLSNDTVIENTPDSTYVGGFSSVDQDKGDLFTYRLVSGVNASENSAFVIKGNRLILIRAANYEKKSTYHIRVRTQDNQGLSLDTALTILIKDLNETPKIVLKTYEISELADAQTDIGHIEVTDEDKNQSYTFQLMNPDVPFQIDASTGMLSLGGSIDYERKKEYDVLIKVKDSGTPTLSDSTTITIKIMDEIEDDLLPSADLVSPNGDGKNDTWRIRNVYLYKDFSLQIVDQNSQLVYSVDHDYDNDWEAKLNGEVLPNGIYYYVFKSNKDSKLFKGYITVLK